MIYPLLPALVTGVLGAGPQALGALDGAADFAASFVKLGAGRLADRPARRGALVVGGYALAVLVRPVIALAGAAWQVIGLRAVGRLGKGLRSPPRDALIADATPPAIRGRAFGLQRGLDHAGAVLGPLVAWYLLSSRTADVRHVIAASIVPGVLVLVLAVWAVRDGRERTETDEGSGTEQPRPAPSAAVRLRPPLALLAITAFYLLRMPEALLILRSPQLGVSVATGTLLWATLHVVRSASSFVAASWSDRLGAGRTMSLGWIAYAALMAGMAAAHTPLQAWAAFLALGVVAGLTEGPERALVARQAGSRQGSGFGGYYAATGFAALAGGLLLGAAFQAWGGPRALGVSAAAAAALALGAAPAYWWLAPRVASP